MILSNKPPYDITHKYLLSLAIILLLSACYRCPKGKITDYYSQFKSEEARRFINSNTAPIRFYSDSGKSILFDQNTYQLGENTANPCEPENCCYERFTIEESRLVIYSPDNDFSFQLHLYSQDSQDVISVVMFSQNQKKYSTYTDFYRDENFLTIKNQTDSNCQFLDSITLNQRTFKNVYEFKAYQYVPNPLPFADRLYYSPSQGIVAFRFNDKSLWTINP